MWESVQPGDWMILSSILTPVASKEVVSESSFVRFLNPVTTPHSICNLSKNVKTMWTKSVMKQTNQPPSIYHWSPKKMWKKKTPPTKMCLDTWGYSSSLAPYYEGILDTPAPNRSLLFAPASQTICSWKTLELRSNRRIISQCTVCGNMSSAHWEATGGHAKSSV